MKPNKLFYNFFAFLLSGCLITTVLSIEDIIKNNQIINSNNKSTKENSNWIDPTCGVIYKLDDSTSEGRVIGLDDNYLSHDRSIKILEYVNTNNKEYKITAINDNAFAGKWISGDLILPKSINYIGTNAFNAEGNSWLIRNNFNNVYLPNNLNLVIKESAFEYSCINNELFFYDNISYLPDSFLVNGSTQKIRLPSNLKQINNFALNAGLVNLYLPKSVDYISRIYGIHNTIIYDANVYAYDTTPKKWKDDRIITHQIITKGGFTYVDSLSIKDVPNYLFLNKNKNDLKKYLIKNRVFKNLPPDFNESNIIGMDFDTWKYEPNVRTLKSITVNKYLENGRVIEKEKTLYGYLSLWLDDKIYISDINIEGLKDKYNENDTLNLTGRLTFSDNKDHSSDARYEWQRQQTTNSSWTAVGTNSPSYNQNLDKSWINNKIRLKVVYNGDDYYSDEYVINYDISTIVKKNIIDATNPIKEFSPDYFLDNVDKQNLIKLWIYDNKELIFKNLPSQFNINDIVAISLTKKSPNTLTINITLNNVYLHSVIANGVVLIFDITSFSSYYIDIIAESNKIYSLGDPNKLNTDCNESDIKNIILNNKNVFFKAYGDVTNFDYRANLSITNLITIIETDRVKFDISLKNSNIFNKVQTKKNIIINNFYRALTELLPEVATNGINATAPINKFPVKYWIDHSNDISMITMLKQWIIDNLLQIINYYGNYFPTIDEILKINFNAVANNANSLEVNLTLKNAYIKQRQQIGEKDFKFNINLFSTYYIDFNDVDKIDIETSYELKNINENNIYSVVSKYTSKIFNNKYLNSYDFDWKNNLKFKIIKNTYKSDITVKIYLYNYYEYYDNNIDKPLEKNIILSGFYQKEIFIPNYVWIIIAVAIALVILITLIIIIVRKRRNNNED